MSGWLMEVYRDLPAVGLAAGLPFAALGLVAWWRRKSTPLGEVLLPLAAVSILGAVAGMAGGSSRTGVVGDVIPAALALIGTISIYVFGAKPERGAIVAITAAGFALALGLGYAAGAGKRGPLDATVENLAFCTDLFSQTSLYEDDARLARAAYLFGEFCGGAFGLSHNRTVTNPSADSAIPYLKSRFGAACQKGGASAAVCGGGG